MTQSTSKRPDLLKGDIQATMKQMTVPVLFGMITLMSFNLVDTFFISMLGTAELAAVSFTFPVTFTVISLAIGLSIGAGTAKVLKGIEQMDQIQPGDVLVTDMTDPDWEPIMKRASAIVTNRGGRTCHAAIIARELGVPAVVGCGDVTDRIKNGQLVTVSCAEGDTGYIYEGKQEFEVVSNRVDALPALPMKIRKRLAMIGFK